ncbi:hypothetical protein Pla110_02800 [Polystyrenella longa]|uniref:Uncharacterized protein n=1 Tax=Polystyrenella longa TaxID=2528007 RepID=A0A518CH75_9PLAN|nr:hypothetical protein [Polystyrenella longa]QDU78576.1 hypothetical protein Pla110_02800 [Polystyrenella longa]
MSDTVEHPEPRAPFITGPRVVLMMFGFGILMVGTLWVYFEIKTRPFRDLTEALAVEFPESRPLVQGGQERLNDEEKPVVLRVLVTVTFDPQDEALFQKSVDRIQQLCDEHQDLSLYEQLEIHLIQRRHQQEPIARATIRDL